MLKESSTTTLPEEVPIICDSLSSIRNTDEASLILRYENLLRDQISLKKQNPTP